MLRKVHIRRIVFILGTVLALGVSPTNVLSFHTSVLYTAPHESLGTYNYLACMIINVSDQPRDVTVEVISLFGEGLADDDITLEPGPVHKTAVKIGGTRKPSYCKFTVDGTPSDFRAHACLLQTFVGCLSTSEAYPTANSHVLTEVFDEPATGELRKSDSK